MLPVRQKDNQIKLQDKKKNVNPYYLVMSGRFKTAKYVTLCILVVFLLTTVVLFRNEITIENLRYLFKDFEVGDNVNVGPNDTITFDSDVQVNFGMFKGDLVIAGSSYFYLTDLQGNKRLNENSMYSNPVIVTGDKYLLVYGLSEYSYSIYNTFSMLHTETFDYPISAAAVSDKGMYAIVTRSAKYRSVVHLYNENFECIGVVSKDKYVMDVQFNENSSELLITSVYSKDGKFCTEVVNYAPYSDKHKALVEIEKSMPLKTGYNRYNGYSIVFDDKIEFYDNTAKLVNTYELSSDIIPLVVEICKDYTIIVYNKNIVGDDIEIMVFDTNGNLVKVADANGQPKKIRHYKESIYILLDGNICKFNLSDKSIQYFKTEKNPCDLHIIDENTAIVCFLNHTTKVNLY